MFKRNDWPFATEFPLRIKFIARSDPIQPPVQGIRDELMTYGIPPILLILIMPFFSGFILGIAVGFVGASFPLIVPLIPAHDTFTYLLYAVLAYTFGYMGMMLSPVHLCFLVTKDYFKAGAGGSYSYVVKTSIAVLLSAVLLFFIANFPHGFFSG